MGKQKNTVGEKKKSNLLPLVGGILVLFVVGWMVWLSTDKPVVSQNLPNLKPTDSVNR